MSRYRLSGLLLACAAIFLAGASCVEPPAGTAEQNALDVCALANDGDLCDDHQPCTYPDVCMNKKCLGMPVPDGKPCTDGNVCTSNDHCASGVCVSTVEPDGTSCTDGDPCTDPDVCMQGDCQPGGPVVCDDGNICTIDTCETGVGCVFSPRDCGMPPDSGSDAVMTPDSGGVDVAPDLGQEVEPDGPAPDAPAVDTGIDTGAPDAPVDGGAPDADAAVDADASTDGGASDAFDAGGDLTETPPDLRARGGGCACAVGAGADDRGAPAGVGMSAILGMVAILRGRGRGRGRG